VRYACRSVSPAAQSMLDEVGGEDARRRPERRRAWNPWRLVAVGTVGRMVCLNKWVESTEGIPVKSSKS
jgi:hypothetical protein